MAGFCPALQFILLIIQIRVLVSIRDKMCTFYRLSTLLATLMLNSYNRYNGIVTKISVIRSGGVIIAATTIMMRNAYLRYLESISDVIKPIFANTKAKTGS